MKDSKNLYCRERLLSYEVFSKTLEERPQIMVQVGYNTCVYFKRVSSGGVKIEVRVFTDSCSLIVDATHSNTYSMYIAYHSIYEKLFD